MAALLLEINRQYIYVWHVALRGRGPRIRMKEKLYASIRECFRTTGRSDLQEHCCLPAYGASSILRRRSCPRNYRNIATRIRHIPAREENVSVSPNMSMPTSVPTAGSMVAAIAAVEGCNRFRPAV